MPQKNAALFTSDKQDWETPDYLFDFFNNIYNFTIDVCADDQNHKCAKYYTIQTNGLAQDWSKDICWMNPPYEKSQLKQWIKKAHEESLKGSVVVCLIPARTDTEYFWNHCRHAAKIFFLKGRLKFLSDGNEVGTATFPSCIVVFDGRIPFPALQVEWIKVPKPGKKQHDKLSRP